MKGIILKYSALLFAVLFFAQILSAQATNDENDIKKACLNYLEGFYEGDTNKLISSLKPDLYKSGYFKKRGSEVYVSEGLMSFKEAKAYAKRVLDKQSFPPEGVPKDVEILDISKATAAAKVLAWWGSDYILLAKQDGKWMIEQVLWEGPAIRN